MSATKWGVKSEIIVRLSKAIISKSSLMEDDKQKRSLILTLVQVISASELKNEYLKYFETVKKQMLLGKSWRVFSLKRGNNYGS